MDKNELFRNIPKVDVLLEREDVSKLIEQYGRSLVTGAIREQTELLRELIRTKKGS